MKKIKDSLIIIGLSVVNFLHSLMHILPFLNPLFLVNDSHSDHLEGSIIIKTIESPYFYIFWLIFWLFTLYLGIKEFILKRKNYKK